MLDKDSAGNSKAKDKPASQRPPGKPMSGEQRAELDRLYSAAFEELHRLAISTRRSRINPAVSTGTLINAAWLELARGKAFAPESRKHFMNIAATVMRHVLIGAARRQATNKRGAGVLSTPLTFDPDSFPIACDQDLLALDTALEELDRIDPRQARIVEEKFFGGFEEAEIAERLGISSSSVRRDWRAARAKLAVALRPTK